jgi:hypothetical protein
LERGLYFFEATGRARNLLDRFGWQLHKLSTTEIMILNLD